MRVPPWTVNRGYAERAARPSLSATAGRSSRPLLVSREAGEQKKALSFLPADKQYLVTRNGAGSRLRAARSGLLPGSLADSTTGVL